MAHNQADLAGRLSWPNLAGGQKIAKNPCSKNGGSFGVNALPCRVSVSGASTNRWDWEQRSQLAVRSEAPVQCKSGGRTISAPPLPRSASAERVTDRSQTVRHARSRPFAGKNSDVTKQTPNMVTLPRIDV